LTGNSHTVGGDTTHRVVLPFYAYAAFSFLAASLLLFRSSSAFTGHFFQPAILAVTHTMALGWGTMIIMGASHQLLPVLTENRLFSVALAYVSFVLAAIGIPLLVYAFYTFQLGWPARWGGSAIVVAIFCFVINIWGTLTGGNRDNVHAVYAVTASVWLLLAAFTGLALVYNFTSPFLPQGSLAYLPFHAHIGIAGWFLLLVIGVGSRLIPMFLISKYANERLLWIIYFLINGGLLSFLFLFFLPAGLSFAWLPIIVVFIALVLFGYYCYCCYRERIRRQVDSRMKISLSSTGMLWIPPILLIILVAALPVGHVDSRLVLVYGFITFFGWITAIILGMTFKTLPFIVWNKIYHARSGAGSSPNPGELVDNSLFRAMMVAWLAGSLVFIAGICCRRVPVLRAGAALLVSAAVLYNWNVWKVLTYKSPAK